MLKLAMELGYRYTLASFIFLIYIDAKRGRMFCFWNIMYCLCILDIFIAKDLITGDLIISLLFAAENTVNGCRNNAHASL